MRSNEHGSRDSEKRWSTEGLEGVPLKLVESDRDARNRWTKVLRLVLGLNQTYEHKTAKLKFIYFTKQWTFSNYIREYQLLAEIFNDCHICHCMLSRISSIKLSYACSVGAFCWRSGYWKSVGCPCLFGCVPKGFPLVTFIFYSYFWLILLIFTLEFCSG